MDDDDIVFLGKRHDLLEKAKISHRGRGIVREIDNQNLGPRERLPIDTGEIFKKIAVLAKLYATDFPAGNDEAVHMDRIGRRRSHDHVAGTDDGQSEVREAFL
jgi:hypothetical protein